MYVTVRNGFHGVLIYKDKHTGEEFNWSEFGDEVDMTLSVLQSARSSQRRFFEENWWLIDNPEVIEYLNVGKYYKDALTYDEFEALFDMDIDEIKAKVQNLSQGQRRGVIYVTKQKIENGELSDLNVIKMLEDTLHIELIPGR